MQKLLITLLVSLVAFSSLLNAQAITSQEIIKKAIELHDEEKYDDAIKLFNKVHENDSNYVWMLSEKALSYINSDKNDSAIYTVLEALKTPSQFKRHLYTTLGTAYDNLNQSEKSIEVYKEAITKYPYNYLLHYNLGITYHKTDKFEEAVTCYQNALKCNPFHSSSHLQLGKVMARQGYFTKAFLSLETFLCLEPYSGRSNKVLIYLENLANSTIDTVFGEPITPFMENSLYAEYDNMIKSKVVLTDEFEAIIDFNAKCVKQTQLLFEILPFKNSFNDFWSELYFPFFDTIKDGNHIVPFLYTILRSSNKESVKKYNKKNEKELKAFYGTGSFLTNYRTTKSITLEGKEQLVQCDFYDNGELYSLGNRNTNNESIGPWEYYYPNGELQARGSFNNGKKIGLWKYYNQKGYLTSSENFSEESILYGEFCNYHESGNKSVSAEYVNGSLNGEVKWFDYYGNLVSVIPFKNDERDGNGKDFYPTNAIKNIYTYANGILTNDFISYHPKGKILSKQFFINDTIDGSYEEFYVNGQLKSSGKYLNGYKDSTWRYYYVNGNLSDICDYKNGEIVGTCSSYYHNGIIKEISTYNDNAELDGLFKYFTPKGKLYFEEEYTNGIITKTASIDRNGKKYGICETMNDSLHFKSYSIDKKLRISGILVNGKKTGLWEYYYKNGNLQYKYNYSDGKLDGETYTYYPNEVIKEKYIYKKDILDGEYISYHENGNIQTQGNYIDGNYSGLWHYYGLNGKLEQLNYYENGRITGNSISYGVNGEIISKRKFSNGLYIGQYDYNQNNEIISRNNLLDTTYYRAMSDSNSKIMGCYIVGGLYEGPLTWYHPNGQIFSQKTYINDLAEGDYARYFEDGKIEINGNFLNNNKMGKWTTYHENGKPHYIENFFLDENDSLNLTYYDNGNIYIEEDYFNGILDGNVTYYEPDGERMVRFIYSEDELIGYQYNSANGDLCDTIFITENDQKIVAYYQDGGKSYECQLKGFVKHGPRFKYFKDGSIMEQKIFKNDLLDGETLTYYKNGNLKRKFICKDGDYQGIYQSYWENGKPKETINYVDNQKHGKHIYYNKKGKIIKTELYWNDRFIGYEN